MSTSKAPSDYADVYFGLFYSELLPHPKQWRDHLLLRHCRCVRAVCKGFHRRWRRNDSHACTAHVEIKSKQEGAKQGPLYVNMNKSIPQSACLVAPHARESVSWGTARCPAISLHVRAAQVASYGRWQLPTSPNLPRLLNKTNWTFARERERVLDGRGERERERESCASRASICLWWCIFFSLRVSVLCLIL